MYRTAQGSGKRSSIFLGTRSMLLLGIVTGKEQPVLELNRASAEGRKRSGKLVIGEKAAGMSSKMGRSLP